MNINELFTTRRNKMAEWMIGVLVVGAILAIAFNVWNKRNPVVKK